MPTTLRIATFNLENWDDQPDQLPTLDERIALMRPQLRRIRADILCLQEVFAQDDGENLVFRALDELLDGTPYAEYERVFTEGPTQDVPTADRNLVILSRYPIREHHQYKHDYAPAPSYRIITAQPPQPTAQDITWERPILHAQIELPGGTLLHVFNVHFRSKVPVEIRGQKLDNYTWLSASAWAEGSFLAALKRLGQAVELRMLIDELFDDDAEAAIVACGDFNCDYTETPLLAIRGDVENTGNPALTRRVMVPCEFTVPEPGRFSLYHRGRGEMIDHILVSRAMLSFYSHTEIHNELLHDESHAFATDLKFPESDHAPVIAEFYLDADI